MASTTLFISQADSDTVLVKALVRLLESGIGVPPKDIFCTALKGQGIKPGADFKESIREQLGDATCVIAVITPRFYTSAFCMCELGGVWIRAKSFIPVLVPPLTYSDLKAVLVGLQALKIAEKADLDVLRDEITERLSLPALPTPRWNEHRDDFVKSLPGVLKRLPLAPTISSDTHKKVLKELEEYKGEYNKSQEEVQRLRAVNAELMKLKDPAKAAAVVRKHSSTVEAFESLVGAVKKALHPLPTVVCEALYYRARGEDYFPEGNETWDDVKLAIENGQLKMNSEDTGVIPRHSDPRVGKAAAALDELEKWLDRPPGDFADWYAATYDDARAEFGLRPFWKKHLL